MIGGLLAAEPAVAQHLHAGRFQLAGGADADHEAPEPDPQEHLGVVAGRASLLPFQADPQARPVKGVELLEIGSGKPDRVVGRNEVIERGGQLPARLPLSGTLRDEVGLLPPSLPPRFETGSSGRPLWAAPYGTNRRG